MDINSINVRKSINKAFLKVKPYRPHIGIFKANMIKLLDQINETESEEFHKNVLSGFLKDTYYSPNHYINTKGRADLMIHTGKDTMNPEGIRSLRFNERGDQDCGGGGEVEGCRLYNFLFSLLQWI